jgi:hypothetical protein
MVPLTITCPRDGSLALALSGSLRMTQEPILNDLVSKTIDAIALNSIKSKSSKLTLCLPGKIGEASYRCYLTHLLSPGSAPTDQWLAAGWTWAPTPAPRTPLGRRVRGGAASQPAADPRAVVTGVLMSPGATWSSVSSGISRGISRHADGLGGAPPLPGTRNVDPAWGATTQPMTQIHRYKCIPLLRWDSPPASAQYDC